MEPLIETPRLWDYILLKTNKKTEADNNASNMELGHCSEANKW